MSEYQTDALELAVSVIDPDIRVPPDLAIRGFRISETAKGIPVIEILVAAKHVFSSRERLGSLLDFWFDADSAGVFLVAVLTDRTGEPLVTVHDEVMTGWWYEMSEHWLRFGRDAA